jgi:hypothetical protein
MRMIYYIEKGFEYPMDYGCSFFHPKQFAVSDPKNDNAFEFKSADLGSNEKPSEHWLDLEDMIKYTDLGYVKEIETLPLGSIIQSGVEKETNELLSYKYDKNGIIIAYYVDIEEEWWVHNENIVEILYINNPNV